MSLATIPTITMPPHKAREQFGKYRKALEQRRGTAGDKAAMAMYRELMKHRAKLIELNAVMKQAGLITQLDDDPVYQLPALAIARADRKRVYFFRDINKGGWCFSTSRQGPWDYGDGRIRRQDWNVKTATFPIREDWRRLNRRNASAIVPTIPPDIRPANLSQYFILWEADWNAAPIDPILLRHVTGTVFSVVAQWDLTEIERMVLDMGVAQ